MPSESKESIVEEVTCPITKQIFYDPVSVDGCGHTFERIAIEQFMKTNNDPKCPICKKDITQLSDSPVVKSITEEIVKRNNLHDQVFFSMEFLSSVLCSQSTKLHSLLTFLNASGRLNEISNEDGYKGASALTAITAYPIGRAFLKRSSPQIRDGITEEAFNAKWEVGPQCGTSAVFWLASDPEGRQLLLENPRLIGLININTLMYLIPEGERNGQSAYRLLEGTVTGQRILNHPELQQKIADSSYPLPPPIASYPSGLWPFIPFIKSIPKKQIIGYCFLALLGGAYLVNEIAQYPEKDHEWSEKDSKHEGYHKICTHKYTAEDMSSPISEAITGSQDAFELEYINSFDCRDLKICNDSTYDIYMNMWNKIELLRGITSESFDQPTSFALISLLKQSLEEDSAVKIHHIKAGIVVKPFLAAEYSNIYMDYFLLDSDLSKVRDYYYYYDRYEVRRLFAQLTRGKICDPRLGYYAQLNSTKGSYVFNEYSITTLMNYNFGRQEFLHIREYSLDFPGFEKLSTQAQQIICKNLKAIDLDVKPKSWCRLFDKPAIAPHSNGGQALNREFQLKIDESIDVQKGMD